MPQPSYLSNSVHAVLRLQDLEERRRRRRRVYFSEVFLCKGASLRGEHTWEIRLSQPILLRPAAARMMAAKSSFSSSFFNRVLRFPRWGGALRKTGQRRLVSATEKGGLKDTMSLKSRCGNLFFSCAARRSELVPITLRRHRGWNGANGNGSEDGSDRTCSPAARPEFSQRSLGGAPRHHGGFLSWRDRE